MGWGLLGGGLRGCLGWTVSSLGVVSCRLRWGRRVRVARHVGRDRRSGGLGLGGRREGGVLKKVVHEREGTKESDERTEYKLVSSCLTTGTDHRGVRPQNNGWWFGLSFLELSRSGGARRIRRVTPKSMSTTYAHGRVCQ